jgi:hypothetical protein
MGYIFVAILALILIGVFLASLAGRGSRKIGNAGTLPGEETVSPDKPAADSPSPGASVTATPAQQESARQHTPPA